MSALRFALHNIRKIRPFLTEHAAQLLVQALVISRLDYCNALLADLPSNTIKPLQMIQNAAARLVFNEPKRTRVTPLFISLHWLPVAARIKFKTGKKKKCLMLRAWYFSFLDNILFKFFFFINWICFYILHLILLKVIIIALK